MIKASEAKLLKSYRDQAMQGIREAELSARVATQTLSALRVQICDLAQSGEMAPEQALAASTLVGAVHSRLETVNTLIDAESSQTMIVGAVDCVDMPAETSRKPIP